MAYRFPWGQGVAYRVPGDQGVGLQGPRGSRGRPTGSQLGLGDQKNMKTKKKQRTKTQLYKIVTTAQIPILLKSG